MLDIDFRPVLWGLRPQADGATRYVESDAVTETLREFLPSCDLIVGTEEEFAIAGGRNETAAAIDAVRAHTRATLVVKRGAAGCTAFAAGGPPGPGLAVPGVPIEVFNVLGAGDAFMAGFLSGWLRDRPLVECCQRANASGALVVSRHGCAPAMPTQPELEHFLAHGSSTPRLREDATLNHLHRAALRDADPSPLAILACDHRAQFEALAGENAEASARITTFKRLITLGARRALAARPEAPSGGLIIDDRYGASLLPELDTGFWIARPVESPGQRPLEFEGGRNIVSLLRAWPRHHVAKCLVAFDPYDPLPMRRTQIDRMLDLAAACEATQRELLLEIVLPANAPVVEADRRLLDAVREIGAAGILPDWWKLPAPIARDGWERIASTVRTLDRQCRGVLVLGLDAPLAELAPRISAAARHPVCRGFAVGRSIFGDAAREWFAGRIDDAAAIEQIASRYGALVDLLAAASGHATRASPNQQGTTQLDEDRQWTGSAS